MENLTATIITIAPSNSSEYLQDFMKTTFAKLGITISHFHPVIYDGHLAHIKFDFHIEENDGTTNYIERKLSAIRIIKQLRSRPINLTHTPGHYWSMSLS